MSDVLRASSQLTGTSFPPSSSTLSRNLAMKKPRSPNWIDKHLAEQIRGLRLAAEMSQASLGQELGVTFQQIQKYESGKNRLSAARLYEICQIFDVPIASMFEDIPRSAPAPKKDSPTASRSRKKPPR
jgi:DNA-binding XRE family transcriptional regulator